jgi:diguanylate cyclase (GGDEF)-like protein
MADNLRSRNILLINAAAILLFSIVLVVFNLYLLDHVNRNLGDLDAVRSRKLQLVSGMANIARERSALMLKIYIEKDMWQQDAYHQRFYSIAGDFIKARDEFRETGLAPAEQEVLASILSVIRVTEPLQQDIVERIWSGESKGVLADITGKDLPRELELLGLFENLTNVVVENANRARAQSNSDFRKIVTAVEAISALIILTIVALMVWSLRKVGAIERNLVDEAERLGRDASLDPLTGVYNRRWLQYRIDTLADDGRRDGETHALVYIDLDGFKKINDAYGHAVGDQYLVRFCREIEGVIRHHDAFCRMGGDEFAILLEDCRADAATRIAQNILTHTRDLVVTVEGHPLRVTCSIGVCLFGQDDARYDELLRRADALCYRAKSEGRNTLAVEGA